MTMDAAQNPSSSISLPAWVVGMTGFGVSASKIETLTTKPPKYFNEGTLIIAMKNVDQTITDPSLSEFKRLLKGADGIGTPATRGSIIDNLRERLWIEEVESGLRITERGDVLLHQVPEDSGFRNPVISAYWEMGLKRMEKSGSDSDFDDFSVEMIKCTHELVTLLDGQEAFKLPGSVYDFEMLEQDEQPCKTCQIGRYKTLLSKGKPFLKCQNQNCGHAIFPPEVWNADRAKPNKAGNYKERKGTARR